MKRLTIRNSDGTVSQPTTTTIEDVFYRLAEYEDTGLEPGICAEYKKFEDNVVKSGTTLRHMLDLAAAEQEGRLVVLPCNVGDTVYKIFGNTIYPVIVDKITINRFTDPSIWVSTMLDFTATEQTHRIDLLNKYGIYFTEEEAEAALHKEGL